MQPPRGANPLPASGRPATIATTWSTSSCESSIWEATRPGPVTPQQATHVQRIHWQLPLLWASILLLDSWHSIPPFTHNPVRSVVHDSSIRPSSRQLSSLCPPPSPPSPSFAVSQLFSNIITTSLLAPLFLSVLVGVPPSTRRVHPRNRPATKTTEHCTRIIREPAK